MNTIFSDAFLTDHFGSQYLHIPEMVTDPADLFNHDDLSDMLNNRRMWAPASLLVMNDTLRVPQAEYFDPPIAPGDGPRLNMEKLNTLIRQGCSMVLNDVVNAHPKLRRFAHQLKTFMGGRVQANLYFSMGGKKAFGPHYDTHDVFALHTAGEKVWNIYENRETNPIGNDIFLKSVDERRKLCGALQEPVTLKPGSLLYLPRGKFHDALASGNGAIHIAFGVTRMKPVDLFEPIWTKMMMEDWIRGDMAPDMSGQDIAKLFDKFAETVKSYGKDKAVMKSFQQRLAAWPMHEDDIDITPLLGEDIRYQVSKAVKIALKNNKPHLTDGKKFMELSADMAKALNHVLTQNFITSTGLVTALGYDAAQADDLLATLKRMGVIR